MLFVEVMKLAVISVGGSILVPRGVDVHFLKKIKKLLLAEKNYRFVLCTGGGHTAREYIAALKKEGLNEYTQDLVGIEVTKLNAKLLASFVQDCNQKIPENLEEIKELLQTHRIVVVGGLSPGRTSDGTTATIADYLDAEAIINMTNVAGLFDKDPRKHKGAKFIEKISHHDFGKMLARVKMQPGMHFVLDDVAAEICKNGNMKVVILQGVENLKKYLGGKKFIGTVIE